MIFSTRPCVVAGIQRMSSGTRVPRPRTCRTIGPRLTVSGQTTAISTVGAAGFRRESPSVIRPTAARATTAQVICRIRFFLALDGRAISMVVSRTLDGKQSENDQRLAGANDGPIGSQRVSHYR